VRKIVILAIHFDGTPAVAYWRKTVPVRRVWRNVCPKEKLHGARCGAHECKVARADARSQRALPVRDLWKIVSHAILVQEAPADAHGQKSVHLRDVPTIFILAKRVKETHAADTQGRVAVLVQRVRRFVRRPKKFGQPLLTHGLAFMKG